MKIGDLQNGVPSGEKDVRDIPDAEVYLQW